MINLRSELTVLGISENEFLEFMLNCTDDDYQAWWSEMHYAFHTLQRYPGQIGNVVYFDERVGSTRLKFKGIITDYVPGRRIVWQMMKGLRFPAWLMVECQTDGNSLHIIHTLRVGFKGVGRIIDPLIRIGFSKRFSNQLDEHAHTEFPLLAELLIKRRQSAIV